MSSPVPARASALRPRALAGRLWVPLVYLVALGFLYRPMFLGDRAAGFGWDTIEAYWSDLAYLADRLRHGEWPLWDVFEKLGYPDLGMPERGLWYPLNWLLAGWGAALGEVPWWLIQLKVLLHHLLAGLLMHAYLRRRGLPSAAALIGGLGWMSSAGLLIHKASSILWPLVWLPLVWLAIDRAITRRDWRSAALLGGALGLIGSAGSAPGYFYLLLVAVPYGGLRLVAALRAAHQRGVLAPTARRLLAVIGGAALVAGALLAVWVVPAGELTAMSQRAERGMAYATSFALPAGPALAGLVAPLCGVADAYVGVAVLALALAALAARPTADGGVPFLAAAIAAVALVLAFGAATPILPWLVAHVPGFDLFRAANRFKLCAAPALCVAAAHGVAALRVEGAARRRALGALAAVAALVVVLAVGLGAARTAPPLALGGMIALGLGAVAALTAVALGPAWATPWLLAAVAAFVVYDPQRYVHARDAALEARPSEGEADRRWLAGLGDLVRDGALWDEFVLEQRPGPRLGVRELRGYPAGSSLELTRYADLLAALRRAPELLAAYGVRAVLWGPHHRIGHGAHILARPPNELAPRFFTRVSKQVYAVRQPAPVAAWYGAAELRVGARAVLDGVRATLSPDRPRRTIVLEDDGAAALGARLGALTEAAPAPPAAVPGTIAQQGANRVVVEQDAPAAGVAVLAHTLYPGWRARVDGATARPFLVDHLVRGVAVDAGHHVIEWELRPAGHGLRLAGWWLALLAVLCALPPPRPPKSI